MSDLIRESKLSDSKDCPASIVKPIHQKLVTRNAQIGEGLTIRRALPHQGRRMIGAWCFFDHFGPLDLRRAGLDIGPHPHMGLQTFTWPISGQILHRDSLGSEQVIEPGQVNLMTAGKGIAHSEESLPDSVLHGVQLWIALPDEVRFIQPEFAHYPHLPNLEQDNLSITVVAGELLGLRAPTKVYSPLIGLDLHASKNEARTTLPMNPAFEYGILVLAGSAKIEEETIETGVLLYLGSGRTELALSLPKDARIFMIGGEPFEEEVLLWWNFVARSREEFVEGINDWNHHRRFGEVKGYQGKRLEAPEISTIK
jgi:redox-sensitive bicupin YhaK (pirin superfamily)